MKTMIVGNEELRKILEQKLYDGWMIFAGNIECVSHLEELIYPPGTEENRNFEICLGATKIGFGLSIGKKTDKLKKFLNIPDFDTTVALIFTKKYLDYGEKKGFITQQIYKNPNVTIDVTINEVLGEILID